MYELAFLGEMMDVTGVVFLTRPNSEGGDDAVDDDVVEDDPCKRA